MANRKKAEKTLKMLRKKLKKHLPKRFFSRIGSSLIYLFPLSQALGLYGGPLFAKSPLFAKIIKSIPFVYHYIKYQNRWSSMFGFIILNKLFLKRKDANEKVIIDTPYFLKHHICHALILMISLSLPELFVFTFDPPRTQSKTVQQSMNFLIINFLIYTPCILSALLGRYNNIPMVSQSVLYFIGDSPDKDGPILTEAYWMKTSRFYKEFMKENNLEEEDEQDDDDSDDDDGYDDDSDDDDGDDDGYDDNDGDDDDDEEDEDDNEEDEDDNEEEDKDKDKDYKEEEEDEEKG